MPTPVITKDQNALEKYQAEAAANPNSADAQANLGWGYYGKGQLPEALKVLQQALALDPNHLEAHYALALVHKASGSKMEAIAEFETLKTLADQVEDPVRQQMLKRIIQGHINEINTGDWSLGRHEQHA